MPSKKQAKTPVTKPTTRMSVSFPTGLHAILEQIAERQKVSVGWVVREAAEKYVTDRWPLLREETRK
jgi:metal-responsive CopG/Arc/MetJ family transcriptional regulator